MQLLQAPAAAEEAAVVTGSRVSYTSSWLRSSFSTKAQNQETEEPAAPEASGSSEEQAAESEQQAVDPKDQLLAERDQQVIQV